MARYIDMSAKAEISQEQLMNAGNGDKGNCKLRFPSGLSEAEKVAVMERLKALGIFKGAE